MLDDSALLPALANTGTDDESRIMQRAQSLARQHFPQWLDGMRQWQTQAWWVLAFLSVVAALSGFFSALGLMNAGAITPDGRALNVPWMLLALLAAPSFSLVVWLVSAMSRGSQQTPLGQLALWLQRHVPGKKSHSLLLGQDLLGLLAQKRLLGLGMGSLSHGLWLLALAGALLGCLLMLATQRHVFVWETTILQADVFVDLVHFLGRPLALFNLPTPSREMILASGNSHVQQDDAARQAWAAWLLGCVLVYGVLPRLLALATSFAFWVHGLANLRLDLKRPGFAMQRARLQQIRQNLGIIDPAPTSLSLTHKRDGQHDASSGQAALAAFELGGDLPWPPDMSPEAALTFRVYPRIDSREERQRLLDQLAHAHAPSLLIAVDPRLSPDRGSLHFLNQLAMYSAIPMIWLVGKHERVRLWRETLLQAGWPGDALLDDAAANVWLGGAAWARR